MRFSRELEELACDAQLVLELGLVSLELVDRRITLVARLNSKALADSAVVILARCTTKAADFEGTLFDLTRAIKERLDREGISMPVARPVLLKPADSTKQA